MIADQSKSLTMCGWDDVPHLDQQTRIELLGSTPEYLRKARTQGIPSLGSGAIYPIDADEFRVAPFPIPPHWPRAYALDVGWNRTAALWLAIDRDNDTVYFYSEHYRGQAEPVVHAQAINARGSWIPGVIDPAARGRSQNDGQQLYLTYVNEHNLKLQLAQNAVQVGIDQVFARLSSGRLKVFANCTNYFAEHNLYHRNENGVIVKKNDHLMDCGRYAILSGLQIAITKPIVRFAASSSAADTLAGY